METDAYDENENYEIDEFETEESEEEEIESTDLSEEEDAQSFSNNQEEDEEKNTIKKNLAKFKRDYFRAARENHDLKEKLNQTSTQFNDFSFMQAENNGKLMLEKARLDHQRALQEGDYDAYYKTIENITRATAQLENLKAMKAQQDSQSSSYAPEYHESPLDPDVQEWLDENTWYSEHNPDFDAQKQQEIGSYAQKLDDFLARSGRQHEINSPAYFEKINQKIRAYDQRNNGRSHSMKAPSIPVAPVRGGMTALRQAPQKKKISLHPQHKIWAEELNMSHDEYAKYIMEFNKKEKDRASGRGSY